MKVYFTIVCFFLLTGWAWADPGELVSLPEPTSMLLVALGLVGLAGVWRKFKK